MEWAIVVLDILAGLLHQGTLSGLPKQRVRAGLITVALAQVIQRLQVFSRHSTRQAPSILPGKVILAVIPLKVAGEVSTDRMRKEQWESLALVILLKKKTT
jgi:hypothetical protein